MYNEPVLEKGADEVVVEEDAVARVASELSQEALENAPWTVSVGTFGLVLGGAVGGKEGALVGGLAGTLLGAMAEES